MLVSIVRECHPVKNYIPIKEERKGKKERRTNNIYLYSDLSNSILGFCKELLIYIRLPQQEMSGLFWMF